MNRFCRSGWIGLLLLVAGCAKEPEIEHLHIERGDKFAKAPVPHPELGGPPHAKGAAHGEKQRLLAAMIPSGELVWFFRMSGPEAAVTEYQPLFSEIVHTLKFADPGLPKWTLPQGWVAEEPDKPFRLKTLRPVENPKNVEIAVSKLDKAAGGGDVLLNVNRWRGQLGLAPAVFEDLPEFSKALEVDGRKGLIVDLVGTGGQPMGGPMMGKGKRPAPLPAATTCSYKLPAGWTKVAPNNSIIREQMKVDDNGETAEVTIVVLPAGGGDPFDNVNRWRKQIGLPPLEEEEDLKKILTRVPVDGFPAAMVDLVNPKAPAPNRILGVMILLPGEMWFLKMRGPDALVGRQKANFEAFTRSFKVE